MASYLVTGGAGFIGSHIVAALAEAGHDVRALDNLSTGKRSNVPHSPRVTLIEGDVLDPQALSKAIKGVDAVYHQAAMASVPNSVAEPLDCHAACATSTVAVLDAARRTGVRRVIYAGSSSCYGNQPYSAKRETDTLAPLSPYAAAKLAGEAYCQAFYATYGLETVVIRYFNVFGPRQDPNSEYSAVIPKFLAAMLQGKRPTVFGDGKQSRDFTYVENIVAGNLAAAEAPAEKVAGRVFNVACGKQFSLLDLIASINRVLGTKLEPVFEPPRAGDVRESLADISTAREALGYEPTVDFDEGLARSIEYYRTIV